MKRENLTKGMIRRAAMMLLMCVLTMTVQTAWAQEHSGTTDDGLTWELTQDGNGENVSKLGACRAYFDLSDGVVSVREFVLNFGEETSSMHNAQCTIHDAQCTMHNEAGAWFDVQGRKLDAQPRKAGLYIHGGRTVVIKKNNN